uniref:Ig-like domain-containing protein n=1 Tax=Sphaeramia orbicularis TaxID=375764 RepID=A0A673BT47_9TELE
EVNVRLTHSTTNPSISADTRAALLPVGFRFFEYRPLSLSCGHNSSWSGWTVRRFTRRGTRTSRCGVDWGEPTSSGCVLETAKEPDSAIYWCELDTRRSNSANITVHGGPVILQSPVLPVMEGQEVSLHCQTRTPSNRSADFYKDGSFIGAGPTGHMTIPQVSQAHQAPLPPECVFFSECVFVFLSSASVSVSPSSTQHPEYSDIAVSCERLGSGWTVWRLTARGFLSQCGSGWGDPTSSGCDVRTVKPPDTGLYWCESTGRQSSHTVNITVTDGAVVLQSPAVPVTEGQDVTLFCQTKTPSDLPAHFYKDGTHLSDSSEGHMTIRRVSRSDEGEYRCGFEAECFVLFSSCFLNDVVPPTLTVSPDSSEGRPGMDCMDSSTEHYRVKAICT